MGLLPSKFACRICLIAGAMYKNTHSPGSNLASRKIPKLCGPHRELRQCDRIVTTFV